MLVPFKAFILKCCFLAEQVAFLHIQQAATDVCTERSKIQLFFGDMRDFVKGDDAPGWNGNRVEYPEVSPVLDRDNQNRHVLVNLAARLKTWLKLLRERGASSAMINC